MNFSASNLIANLMAAENLKVVQGDYQTASFDLKNRVIYVPRWSIDNKFVSDLFIGHEISHALHTPESGWHDAVVDLGVPKGFLNVIEDVRIERLILERYPGLLLSFSRGYKKLIEDDFFGLSKVPDVNLLSFIDRINLHTKTRGYIPVTFSQEEMPYVKRVMETQTFADVVNVAKDILDFVKNRPEEKEEEETGQQGNDSERGEGETSQQQIESVGNDDNDDESNNDDDAVTNEASVDDDKKEDELTAAHHRNDIDETRSLTDEAQRDNEKRLLPLANTYITHAMMPTMDRVKMTIHDEKELNQLRAFFLKAFDPQSPKKIAVRKRINKVVDLYTKEFQRKKAAHESKKASTARTGDLDMNRLHEYKNAEDIFKSSAIVRNGQNHGIFVVIDMSGSMIDSFQEVFTQTVTLCEFCRKLSIPFEVYGYTGSSHNNSELVVSDLVDSSIILNDTLLFKFADNRMSRKDYNLVMDYMINKIAFSVQSITECRGSTPTNEVLMCSAQLINEFKRNNGVEICNFVLITDGEPNIPQCYVRGTDGQEDQYKYLGIGSSVRISDSRGNVVNKNTSGIYPSDFSLTFPLLEYIKNHCGANINLYLLKNDTNGDLIKAFMSKEEQKDFNANGFLVKENEEIKKTIGNVFLLSDSYSSGKDEENFKKSNMRTSAMIKKGFMENAEMTKSRKVFAQRMIESIATGS